MMDSFPSYLMFAQLENPKPFGCASGSWVFKAWGNSGLEKGGEPGGSPDDEF